MRALLPALGILLASTLAAQTVNTLPGNHEAGASRQRALYEAAMRAKVDSLMTRWEDAFRSRDGQALAFLYEHDATITFSTGSRLRGQDAIRSAYGRLFTRMRRPHIDVVDFTRKDGTASVAGTITFEVNAGAGWYAHSAPISFSLRIDNWEHYLIQEQTGGDIVSFIALTAPPAYLSTDDPQPVRVRLVDASGDGVGGKPVFFSVDGKGGAIEPRTATTDAQGYAAATFTPSSLRETDTVTAAVLTLPDERLSFRFRMLESSAVSGARALLVTMGTREQLDSVLSATIDSRRHARPDVPEEFWDTVARESAVDAALDSLSLLYAERLSPATVRAMDSVYRSPTGREFVAARTALFGDVMLLEQQWRTMLDSAITARLKAEGYPAKR